MKSKFEIATNEASNKNSYCFDKSSEIANFVTECPQSDSQLVIPGLSHIVPELRVGDLIESNDKTVLTRQMPQLRLQSSFQSKLIKTKSTAKYETVTSGALVAENDTHEVETKSITKCETVTSGPLVDENKTLEVETISTTKCDSVTSGPLVAEDETHDIQNDVQLITDDQLLIDSEVKTDIISKIINKSIDVQNLPIDGFESNMNKINGIKNQFISVEKVILEPLRSKRGRPKGSNLNRIGLSKNQKNFNCISFEAMSNFQKVQIMLPWIVNNDFIKERTLGCDLVDVTDFKSLDQIVPWFYNKEVDIAVLQEYMKKEAYSLLNECLKKNENDVIWICVVCNNDLHKYKSISCDQCMEWMHFKCIGLKKSPPTDVQFFCNSCKSK